MKIKILIIIAIALVLLLGRQPIKSDNNKNESFDSKEYLKERIQALKGSDFKIFDKVEDDIRIKNDISDNLLKYDYVEFYWNKFYRENNIDSMYLIIETRDLSYYELHLDDLEAKDIFQSDSDFAFINTSHAVYDVVVLFKHDGLYSIATWGFDPKLNRERNREKQSDTTIFYQHVPKDKFENFLESFYSEFEPLKIKSFFNDKFSSTHRLISTIKVFEGDKSNVFWIINSEFFLYVDTDLILNYFDSQIDTPIHNCDSLIKE